MKHIFSKKICGCLAILLLSTVLSSCTADKQITDMASRWSMQTTNITPPSHDDKQLQQTMAKANNKLEQFRAVLQLMLQNGDDTAPYQKLLDQDKAALHTAKSLTVMQNVAKQIDKHMTPDQFTFARALAQYQVTAFHQEVTSWGEKHQYHDSYNGKDYPLDYEYDSIPNDYGAGSDLDDILQSAQTLESYQAVISQVNTYRVLFKAMQDDAQDTTIWQQPHAVDQRLIQHFQATQGQAIVVSLAEQTLHLYQDDTFIKAYPVVTGLYERPTPPGAWQIRSHIEQTWFTTFEAPGTQFYFPPTLVHWAMGFNDPALGYFIHASPWRSNYGKGSNFPHYDPHNDNTESRDGSHGCINLPLDQAQWLYQQVADGTTVITF